MYGVSARNGRWDRISGKYMYNGGGVTDLLKVLCVFFLFLFFIYLAALGLSCGTWDL